MSGSSARAHIINLRDYFLHRADLAGRWSDKERRHLSEVRGIYKMLALVAALALCVLAVLLWLRPTWVKRAALVNYALVLSLVLIVPAFGVFWRDLFHPLLFSNYDWLTNTGDVTWYITPRVFFRNSLIAMIILALLCNTAIYLVSKYRMARVSA